MNDALKNPVLVFLAGLLAIWLVFRVLKAVISSFWLIVFAFVILFLVHPGFRSAVQRFFSNLFR